jgi:hypothetical protein
LFVRCRTDKRVSLLMVRDKRLGGCFVPSSSAWIRGRDLPQFWQDAP